MNEVDFIAVLFLFLVVLVFLPLERVDPCLEHNYLVFSFVNLIANTIYFLFFKYAINGWQRMVIPLSMQLVRSFRFDAEWRNVSDSLLLFYTHVIKLFTIYSSFNLIDLL